MLTDFAFKRKLCKRPSRIWWDKTLSRITWKIIIESWTTFVVSWKQMKREKTKEFKRWFFSISAAIDSKPPKSMILGQKCRDRARKEIAQLSYTQNVLDDFALKNPESFRGSARSRSRNSFVQSQVKIFSVVRRENFSNDILSEKKHFNFSR